MSNQDPSGLSKNDLYEQLSEDWRSRDRITWQLPAVLVIVGGLLLGNLPAAGEPGMTYNFSHG